MMLLWGLMTLAWFPVYLAVRRPFFTLPLHIDTGFYVSNSTICRRRFKFAEGWNAHFAGCSKFFPEWWHSTIYLRCGPDRYPKIMRFVYSVYNYGVAILVGILASLLGHSPWWYGAGLVLYSLLSSEPQYGVYFESAEQFEILWQVLGVTLIVLGLQNASVLLVGCGFGCWIIDAVLVKLSAWLSYGVLVFGVGWVMPQSIPVALLAGAAGGLAYLAWVARNQQSVRQLVGPLLRHERYLKQHTSSPQIMRAVARKGALLWRLFGAGPVIPALAILGAAMMHPTSWTMWDNYAISVGAAYVFQAGYVWYYAIPLLPVMALAAVYGVNWLIASQGAGWLVVLLLGCLWGVSFIGRPYRFLIRKDVHALNRWVWRWVRTPVLVEKNAKLETAIPALRRWIGTQSVFISGPWSQAYVLLGASYETPVVCTAPWLDTMVPGWFHGLNQRLVSQPPAFVLDTQDGLDPTVLQQRLGLIYRQVESFEGGFQLYAFQGREERVAIDLAAQPWILHPLPLPSQDLPSVPQPTTVTA